MPLSDSEWRRLVESAADARPSTFLSFPQEDAFMAEQSEALGLDVKDYTFMIEAARLRHVVLRHGHRVQEDDLGQIPITRWHIDEIPTVLLHPHTVSRAPGFDKSRPALKLCRNYADMGVAHAIVLLRSTASFKNLVFQTLYWYRPG